MRSKLSTVVFSQGWLDGQFESLVNKTAAHANEDPTGHLIATQMQEQWTIITDALDDLIKEHKDMSNWLAEMKVLISRIP